jgi:hypothetical protein
MELTAVDLAAGVVDATATVLRRPVLARERRMLLERVGARGDVDRLREARVSDRAVVALEKVLARDLPVRPLGLRPLGNERVDADTAVGGDARKVARWSASGSAFGSGLR